MIRSLNKEYAPIGGEGDFCQKAAKLAEISNVLTEARNVTIQGISGTGFFTISAELWGSHTPIFKFSGSWLSYFILEGHNVLRSARTELRQEHVPVRREGGGLHRGLHRQGRGRQVSKSQKHLRLLIHIL